MHDGPEVVILRLGHRPGRDDRMTTHVGLTARALGADRVIFSGDATDAVQTVRDVTARFGGPFSVDQLASPLSEIRSWEGTVVHLTMYGQPIQDVETDIRSSHSSNPVLVVVGAEKVPFDVYDHADWNVAITNQPHSEVAGLAVFLDHLFDGRELDRDWVGGTHRVRSRETGKVVEATDGETHDRVNDVADDSE
jgi:tRNA (cytidine56-2'-O)-methyltransferase